MSQPEYWLAELAVPQGRARAIARLEQFFEDEVTRANGDKTAAPVQSLIDKAVTPLTQTYVDHATSLPPRTRRNLLYTLAHYADPRAEPAFRKVFDDFARAPKTERDDDDIEWATVGAEALKSETLIGPLFAAFRKFQAGTPLGARIYRKYYDALLAQPSHLWRPFAPALREMLDVEMPLPRPSAVPELVAYRDQILWQATAAALLGKLADRAAIEPLIRMLLDPAKLDVHANAMSALLQLGAPASGVGLELAAGKHRRLVAHCVQHMQPAVHTAASVEPCKQTGARVVGAIGLPSAASELLALLQTQTDDLTRAVMARELPRLAATAQVKAAFIAVYDSLRSDLEIAPGVPAREALAGETPRLFDAQLVDWLLARARRTQGKSVDSDRLRTALLVSALKLAKQDQLPRVRQLAARLKSPIQDRDLDAIAKLMSACAQGAQCYVDALTEPEYQQHDRQLIGMKAVYMAGLFGDAVTRDALVAALNSVPNAALRFAAAQAIDYLSPTGSSTAEQALQVIIDRNAASPDRDLSAGDAPLRELVPRLAARR